MKRFIVSITLTFLVFNLMAGIHPTVIYSPNKAEYSIRWEKPFAQLNNLAPEIEINSQWISVNEFTKITWIKKEGKRLSHLKPSE